MRRSRSLFFFVMLLLLVGLACSFGAGGEEPTAVPQPTDVPPTAVAAAPTDPPPPTDVPVVEPTEAPPPTKPALPTSPPLRGTHSQSPRTVGGVGEATRGVAATPPRLGKQR
jgi:hypothetical protein